MVDNMRASDPFMQSKMSGSKMKAFHQHVTDEAKEHLGVDLVNNTVTNKIMEHVSTISDTASRSAQLHTLPTLSARPASRQAGPLNHELRTAGTTTTWSTSCHRAPVPPSKALPPRSQAEASPSDHR